MKMRSENDGLGKSHHSAHSTHLNIMENERIPNLPLVLKNASRNFLRTTKLSTTRARKLAGRFAAESEEDGNIT
jgi:hypothetical protein